MLLPSPQAFRYHFPSLLFSIGLHFERLVGMLGGNEWPAASVSRLAAFRASSCSQGPGVVNLNYVTQWEGLIFERITTFFFPLIACTLEAFCFNLDSPTRINGRPTRRIVASACLRHKLILTARYAPWGRADSQWTDWLTIATLKNSKSLPTVVHHWGFSYKKWSSKWDIVLKQLALWLCDFG